MVKHELRVTSYELRVESLKARVDNLKALVEIQNCEFRSTSYEFKSTSYKFKPTSNEFKSTSYEFKSTSYEFKFTSYRFKSPDSRVIKSMKTQVNSLWFFTRDKQISDVINFASQRNYQASICVRISVRKIECLFFCGDSNIKIDLLKFYVIRLLMEPRY